MNVPHTVVHHRAMAVMADLVAAGAADCEVVEWHSHISVAEAITILCRHDGLTMSGLLWCERRLDEAVAWTETRLQPCTEDGGS